MNKYYLLENVKKSDDLIPDFTTYQGGKGQLEQQLGNQEPTFDNGAFGLVGLKNDSRKGHNYLHVLVQGEQSDFSRFESFAESNNVKLVGAKRTDSDSLDDLVSSYLPEKVSEKFGNKAKSVASKVDHFVSTDNVAQVNLSIAAVAGVLELGIAGITAMFPGPSVVYSPLLIGATAGVGLLGWYGYVRNVHYGKGR